MLSLMVLLSSHGFWLTYAMLDPLGQVTFPAVVSISPSMADTREDLPLPTVPTTITSLPGEQKDTLNITPATVNLKTF